MFFFVFFIQVFDQYLNFISLEDDLFVTRHHNTQDLSYYGVCTSFVISVCVCVCLHFITLFSALNRTEALDTDIKRITDTMAESLFSVFVTTGMHN